MRYAVSGHATASILGPTGTLISLLGKPVTPGRAFWLRGLALKRTTSDGTSYGAIKIFDASHGTNTTSATGALGIPAATGVLFNTGIWEFPAPGIKFTTGVCAAYNTCGVTTATGGIACWGYEE